MATTTPNFGWTVPTSSDLVKNGAVAIEITLNDFLDHLDRLLAIRLASQRLPEHGRRFTAATRAQHFLGRLHRHQLPAYWNHSEVLLDMVLRLFQCCA